MGGKDEDGGMQDEEIKYQESKDKDTNQLKPSDMDTKTHTPYVTVLPYPSAVTDNSNSGQYDSAMLVIVILCSTS